MTDSVNSVLPTTSGSANTIYLKPGDDVAAIVNGAAAGSTFVFSAGIYHNVSITPKTNDTFVGQTGAVLDGSVPISGWSNANGYWSASGFPAPGYGYGEGNDGMAQIPEDLVVGGTPYQRVASLSDVGPGKFYYANGQVFIKDDPTGKTTAAMQTSTAFNGDNTTGVTIKNLTVQNYASIAQHGAIEAHDSSGWTLDNVNAIDNHGAGLAGGSNMTVTGGNYSGNGQVGIHVFGAQNVSISGVTADNNNYAGYAQTWDAGGIKVLTSNNVTVSGSDISGNNGVGLWFDTDNQNVNINNNTISDNQSVGILYEASFAANITNNSIEKNAQSGYVDGYWGSGLLILSSSHVNASQNLVVVNDGAQGIGMMEDGRPAYLLSAPVTANDAVSNNTIVMLGRGVNGGDADGLPTSTIFNGTNVWSNNTYVAKDPELVNFTWNSTAYWAVDLKNPPIDADGTFLYGSDPLTMATSYVGTASQGAVTTQAAVVPAVVTTSPVVAPQQESTPPQVAITSQTLLDDTGTSSTDNVTSDGRVVLSGTLTGAAGTTVQIYDGTTAIGAAALTAGGGWTFATTLATGTHGLSAVATDPLGRTAATAAKPTVTVETAPPVIAISAQALAPGANQTTNGAVTLTGTVAGPAGTTVTVYDGTSALGAAQVASNGTWTYATTLAAGAHQLNALASDPAGNRSAALGTALTVTSPAPTVGIASATLSPDAKSELLTGSVTGVAGTAVAIYNGTTLLGAATLDGKGGWSYVANLAPGSYNLAAVATDPTGSSASTNRSFTFAKADTLVINLAEDAYKGDAQFTVSVDGTQIGGVRSVTALKALGQGQDLTLSGSFGNGPHVVGIDFVNDLWGGTKATDRNLYVNTITLDGATQIENSSQFGNGMVNYAIPGSSQSTVSDLLTLKLSEDAYQGDAQFTVQVDGKQIGGAQSVSALHSQGQSQSFTIGGNFGAGPHTVGITFLNDLWGGTAATDRNLYVDSINLDGTTVTENAEQAGQGLANYTVRATNASAGGTVHVGTTLIMDASSNSGLVNFEGASGTLQFNDAQDFGGRIAGFSGSDTIDLRAISYHAASSTTAYNAGVSSGVLSVGDGTHSTRLAFLGDYKASSFQISSDGHGGTAVTLAH